VHDVVTLPGLRGILYSQPCSGAQGGDIHYFSVCGSGWLSRLCVADVAGHGDQVSEVSAATCEELRRSVNTVDDRKVLRALDRRLARDRSGAITTAVLASYFPPTGSLSVSYAGHPEAWLYRRAERRWAPIDPEPEPAGAGIVGVPLGTGLSPSFTRRRLEVEEGDRLLLLSDGVLEAPSDTGDEFGRDGLAQVLRSCSGDCDAVADAVLLALSNHCPGGLRHDDVTLFVGEFVTPPKGPALWRALKNRLTPGRAIVGSSGRRRVAAEGDRG
jgi:serine phosphatase RsbU (regulator of sigma subunit)